VLQCVAVCCSVLQCVAAYDRLLPLLFRVSILQSVITLPVEMCVYIQSIYSSFRLHASVAHATHAYFKATGGHQLEIQCTYVGGGELTEKCGGF